MAAPDAAPPIRRRDAALVVVDMQNDYCSSRGGLAHAGFLPGGTSMIERMTPVLANTIEQARQRALRVVWVRTEYGDVTTSTAWLRRGGGQPLPICRPGTWGAEWFGVAPKPDEIVVTKHRYSPFVNTPFETILRVQGISVLAIAGTTTNVCVESTARDAFMRDYQVVVLSDCTASYESATHESALLNVRRHFGAVMTSGEFLGVLEDR
jgi:ureidoacrylate peracid hydrolase